MNFRMIRVASAALLCALFAPPAGAARRALLIGVSQYAPGIVNLEGPQNDVEALHRMLVDKWGFPETAVQTLVNQAATHDGILAALDRLAAQAKTGDVYFIFFSGHGTSWYAPGRADPELDPSTGAIVASDGRLIFGNRDLQPRLRKIDEFASTFVVFDSCYSGSSVKSVLVGVAKYTDPDSLARNVPSNATSFDEKLKDSFGALTTHEVPYPYKNVVYLAASSRSEMAIDIPRALITSGRYRTVDGQPHGALTDALLSGLGGAADTNHDARITYGELYEYVRQRVNRQWNQTPQILYAATNGAILDYDVLSAQAPAAAESTQQRSGSNVRVRVAGQDNAVSSTLTGIPGITISNDAFDLLIRPTADGWDLYHSSGTLIESIPKAEFEKLIRRIALEPSVRRLVDTEFKRQEFNTALTIDPAGKGFYKVGDKLTFSLRAERASYLLLLNIDAQGVVTVLYPRTHRDAERAATVTLKDQNQVIPPTGTEFLKLFAFTDKPASYDALLAPVGGVTEFEPTDPLFIRLMDMVKDDLPGRSQAMIKVVTSTGKK